MDYAFFQPIIIPNIIPIILFISPIISFKKHFFGCYTESLWRVQQSLPLDYLKMS